MSTVKSNLITVIPAARKDADISKLTSEDTLTRIVRNVSPSAGTMKEGSFIISADTTSTGYIEFCIEGYYVKVPYATISDMGQNVFAKCDYANTSPDISELKGESGPAGNTDYEGIVFTTTAPELPYIQLIKNGTINSEAFLRNIWINEFTQNYCAYEISSTSEGVSTNKIWVKTDLNGHYMMYIHNGTTWVPVTAVAG